MRNSVKCKIKIFMKKRAKNTVVFQKAENACFVNFRKKAFFLSNFKF